MGKLSDYSGWSNDDGKQFSVNFLVILLTILVGRGWAGLDGVSPTAGILNDYFGADRHGVGPPPTAALTRPNDR